MTDGLWMVRVHVSVTQLNFEKVGVSMLWKHICAETFSSCTHFQIYFAYHLNHNYHYLRTESNFAHTIKYAAVLGFDNILILIGMPRIEQRFIGSVHETHWNVPCASINHANFGKNCLPRVQNPNAALD